MILFGHLGVGSKLASPWAKELPRAPLLIGTLLPDLIDKPLYYGLSWATGRQGGDLGLISDTRTFGHTALALLALSGLACLRSSRWLAALALGMASHLLLDQLQPGGSWERGAQSLLWPAFGVSFPAASYDGISSHFEHLLTPWNIGAEVVGLALLLWDHWVGKNRPSLEKFRTGKRRFIRFKRRRH